MLLLLLSILFAIAAGIYLMIMGPAHVQKKDAIGTVYKFIYVTLPKNS
jgi:hypothetical protein